ncbi:hypothetical protein NWFMUON74_64150 [Nocardia wallacei]|uniref:Uncharacterized protein n=1 Tax=Nocardia wallacei TaxID=480035 RepID=A0A7G1KWU0_9NOCA|nr:hypothetical protein NWFMUON74_64150 [Nocardia wallacei]
MFQTGRPIGTAVATPSPTTAWVALTVNSVGPYRLISSTPDRPSRRNASTASPVNASPPTSSARSEVSESGSAVVANTVSSDGTNDASVIRSAGITSDRYAVSRCPSGTAITVRAPVSNGASGSQTEASKVAGVLYSAMSSAVMPNSVMSQRIWWYSAACEMPTPFGRPVDPEVNST